MTEGLTFTPTFHEFKLMTRDFFQNADAANMEELDSMWKAIGLAYLGIIFDETPLGELDRLHAAPIVLKLVGRKYLECQITLERKEENEN